MRRFVAFVLVLIFVMSLLTTCFAAQTYPYACRCGYSYCNAFAVKYYGPWQQVHVWVNNPNGGWWADYQRTVTISCIKGHMYHGWDYK